MGLTVKSLLYIEEMLFLTKKKTKDMWLCDIGDQFLREDVRKYKSIKTRLAHNYFVDLGYNVVTFDVTDGDHVTKKDIRIPVDKVFHNKFDIVLNIGTTEHIASNQYDVFKNIHDLCKLSGIMLHVIPHVSKGHGFWAYNIDFFENLRMFNPYKIIDYKISPSRYGKKFGKEYIYLTFMKVKHRSFMEESNFIEPTRDEHTFKWYGDKYETIVSNLLGDKKNVL